jgi:hypothetical protein
MRCEVVLFHAKSVTKLAITWRLVDKYYINFEVLRDQNMRTLCTVLVTGVNFTSIHVGIL